MDMSNGETSNATIGIIKTITRTIETEQRGLSAMQASLPEGLGDAFAYAAELIELSGGAVVVTGMGKSGLIGRKIAATLASTGTPSHFVHPGEASHGDLGMIGPRDVVLALSWSGETPELANIIAYTRRFDNKLIAITSRADSALGRAADVGLFLPVSEEACPNGLAPTTSTTMQLVAGDALAVSVAGAQRFHGATTSNATIPAASSAPALLTVGQLMHTGDDQPLVKPRQRQPVAKASSR
jgi:arabinose-5-phosphate isomerase